MPKKESEIIWRRAGYEFRAEGDRIGQRLEFCHKPRMTATVVAHCAELNLWLVKGDYGGGLMEWREEFCQSLRVVDGKNDR